MYTTPINRAVPMAAGLHRLVIPDPQHTEAEAASSATKSLVTSQRTGTLGMDTD